MSINYHVDKIGKKEKAKQGAGLAPVTNSTPSDTSLYELEKEEEHELATQDMALTPLAHPMKAFVCPTIDTSLSYIVLNDAVRNYELKNIQTFPSQGLTEDQ